MYTLWKERAHALRSFHHRRGAVLVLAAFLMVMVFAFAAFAIDIGFIALTRARLQNNADAAALAAAADDPLNDPKEVPEIAKQLPEKLLVIPHGGHLGYTATHWVETLITKYFQPASGAAGARRPGR